MDRFGLLIVIVLLVIVAIIAAALYFSGEYQQLPWFQAGIDNTINFLNTNLATAGLSFFNYIIPTLAAGVLLFTVKKLAKTHKT